MLLEINRRFAGRRSVAPSALGAFLYAIPRARGLIRQPPDYNIPPLRGSTRLRLFHRLHLRKSAACRAVLSSIVLGIRDEEGRPCGDGLISGWFCFGSIRAHSRSDSCPFVVLFLCLFAAILYPWLTLKSPQRTPNDLQSGRTAKAV